MGAFYKGCVRSPSMNELLNLYLENQKDHYFRVRNKDQADKSVVDFVFSSRVQKDRRNYSPSRATYLFYKEYCQQQSIEPLGAWQFKRNMQLLGFVYQKHHRFYAGYYGNKVTTAYKNIAVMAE